MNYISRAAEATVKNISDTFPVLLVTGPRQVGKSTMLQKLAEPARTVVTLDDLDVRLLAKTDPGLFMQRHRPPVIIDEIRIRAGAPPLHQDGSGQVAGKRRLVAHGVAAPPPYGEGERVARGTRGHREPAWTDPRAKSKGYPPGLFTVDSTRLMERLNLAKKRGLNEVFDRIFKGSMPKLYMDPNVDWEVYYRSYVSTYLQRDIKDLAQVGDELSFYQFMIAVAARTARPVVYEELAQEVGISSPTAKKWLSILVSSHIVALVQPYHNNALKRITKMPLLHFLDTGLAAYLLKWNNPRALENGAMAGAFFEELCVLRDLQELSKRGQGATHLLLPRQGSAGNRPSHLRKRRAPPHRGEESRIAWKVRNQKLPCAPPGIGTGEVRRREGAQDQNRRRGRRVHGAATFSPSTRRTGTCPSG